MAVKITQCHGHLPLSGKRFSSFASKTTTLTIGEASASVRASDWVRSDWRPITAQPSSWSFSLIPRRSFA